MKKSLILSLTVLTSLSLVGCATLAKLELRSAKLANGKTVYIDTVQPTPDWNCKLLTMQKTNWELMQLKNLDMGQAAMQSSAISYINSSHLNANYVYLQIPNMTEVGGIPVTMGRSAYTSYYQCQKINPNNKLQLQKITSIG